MFNDYVSGQTSVILRIKIINEASATVYTAGGSTIDTITTLGTYNDHAAGGCVVNGQPVHWQPHLHHERHRGGTVPYHHGLQRQPASDR